MAVVVAVEELVVKEEGLEVESMAVPHRVVYAIRACHRLFQDSCRW